MKKKNGTLKYTLSNEKYHAHDAVSKSDIAQMQPTMEHYKVRMAFANQPTNEMELGTAIHCAVLEPNEFLNRYYVTMDIDSKSAKGKEKLAIETIRAFRAGKKLIFKSAADACWKIAKRFNEHPILGKMFDGRSHVECSFFWTDPESGVECKCRPDLLSLPHKFALDLKSTFDPTEEKMEKAVENFYHHYSAYLTTQGVEAVAGVKLEAYFFAAIDSVEPYGIIPYVMGDKSLKVAAAEIKDRLMAYAKARKTNIWEGYTPEIRTLELPRYRLVKSNVLTKEELMELF